MIGTYFGIPYLDAGAAFIICALIIKMGAQMIIASTRELIDTAVDNKTLKLIIRHIRAVPGVQSIHQLRSRSLGGNIFVDSHILVNPKISVSEGHYIADQVYLKLVKNIPHLLDVTIHIDPEDDEHEMPSVDLPNRDEIVEHLKSLWYHLPGYSELKHFQIHYLKGRLSLEIYLPLSTLEKHSSTELSELYHKAVKEFKAVKGVEIYYC